jgi:hypothetical protein
LSIYKALVEREDKLAQALELDNSNNGLASEILKCVHGGIGVSSSNTISSKEQELSEWHTQLLQCF